MAQPCSDTGDLHAAAVGVGGGMLTVGIDASLSAPLGSRSKPRSPNVTTLGGPLPCTSEASASLIMLAAALWRRRLRCDRLDLLVAISSSTVGTVASRGEEPLCVLVSSHIEASAQQTWVSGVISGMDAVFATPSEGERCKSPGLQTALGYPSARSKLLWHPALELAMFAGVEAICRCQVVVDMPNTLLQPGAIVSMTYIPWRDSPSPRCTALRANFSAQRA